MQRHCGNCNKVFRFTHTKGRPPIMCSNACQKESVRTSDRFCVVCGNSYIKGECKAPQGYCSRRCYDLPRCKQCNKAETADADSRFCSALCMAEHYVGKAHCLACGGAIPIPTEPPYAYARVHCSETCRQATSERRHGPVPTRDDRKWEEWASITQDPSRGLPAPRGMPLTALRLTEREVSKLLSHERIKRSVEWHTYWINEMLSPGGGIPYLTDTERAMVAATLGSNTMFFPRHELAMLPLQQVWPLLSSEITKPIIPRMYTTWLSAMHSAHPLHPREELLWMKVRDVYIRFQQSLKGAGDLKAEWKTPKKSMGYRTKLQNLAWTYMLSTEQQPPYDWISDRLKPQVANGIYFVSNMQAEWHNRNQASAYLATEEVLKRVRKRGGTTETSGPGAGPYEDLNSLITEWIVWHANQTQPSYSDSNYRSKALDIEKLMLETIKRQEAKNAD